MSLYSTVGFQTILTEGYRYFAAHESMSARLSDWERCRDRLDRQIEELRALRDQRKIEDETGTWPARDGGGSL